MKILFCSNVELRRELGAAKVLIEIAEGLTQLGWQCELVGPAELCGRGEDIDHADNWLPERLRAYLIGKAAQFDVVDYPHEYLPFPRCEFSERTLLVARSVLLVHHLLRIPIPAPKGSLNRLRHMVSNARRRPRLRRWISRTTLSVRNADLVNVSNDNDKDELIHNGVDARKIEVIPFGLSRSLRSLFEKVEIAIPAVPRVAFVGTFDYRKGAREFPEIVRLVRQAVPSAKFRLLGTKGLFQTKAEVMRHFPDSLGKCCEVYPSFVPEELPALLADCSVGIFPSHMEGFGFGVLEMLAAAIPVIAYDAPGPPMMLSPEFLVKAGDIHSMAKKVVDLLTNMERLHSARIWARERSRKFCWPQIAQVTSDRYKAAIAARDARHVSA